MSLRPQLRILLAALAVLFTLAGGLLSTAAFAQTAAPAAMPAAAPAIDTVTNPYGMEALWSQGDFVSKGTLLILVIMSMGTWYIGIVKLVEQSQVAETGQGRPRKVLEDQFHPGGHPHPARGQCFPLHRRGKLQGQRASRKHATRDRSQLLDRHGGTARHRYHRQPPAERTGLPRHGRLDGAVCGTVRHGVGFTTP